MHKLFVYGTLMSPYGNNRLLKGATYVGDFMVDGSLYGFVIPGFSLTKHPEDPSEGVKGEVWEVDDPTLAVCDSLEGHPTHYFRTTVKAWTFEGEEYGDVFIYSYPGAERKYKSGYATLITSGDYKEYRDEYDTTTNRVV